MGFLSLLFLFFNLWVFFMNRAYRVIFNYSLGVWQCVSEIAKAKGKTKTLKTLALAVAVAVSAQAMAQTQAEPMIYENGQVNDKGTTYNAGRLDIVRGDGTVLKTGTFKNDGQIFSVFTEGKLEATNGVQVTNGGLLNLQNKGRVETAYLSTNFEQSKKPSQINVLSGSSIKASERSYIGRVKNTPIDKDAKDKLIISGVNSEVITKDIFVGDGEDSHGYVKVDDNAALRVTHEGVRSVGKGNAIIGEAGKGELLAEKNANLQIKNSLIIGNKKTGVGTVNIKENSKVNAEKIIVGHQGKGDLTVEDSLVTIEDLNLAVEKNEVTGKSATVTFDGSNLNAKFISVGSHAQAKLTAKGTKAKLTDKGLVGQSRINVTDSVFIATGTNRTTEDTSEGSELIVQDGSVLVAGGTIGVGNTGKGKLSITGKNSSVNTAKDLQIGGWISDVVKRTLGKKDEYPDKYGNGTVELHDNAELTATEIVVGNVGTGTLKVDNSQVDATKKIVVGQQGKGALQIQHKAKVQTPLLQIGNGDVQVENGAVLAVNDIEFLSNKSNPSSIVLSDSKLILGKQTKGSLFANITEKNTIKLIGKTTFDLAENNVTINDNAKITGTGSLIKDGSGTLTLSAKSKGWTGETHINGGTLKLNGNYTFKGNEVLAIGLGGKKDDGTLDSGKLETSGTLDVTKTQ